MTSTWATQSGRRASQRKSSYTGFPIAAEVLSLPYDAVYHLIDPAISNPVKLGANILVSRTELLRFVERPSRIPRLLVTRK
jgi:hypothetical protein